MDDHLFPRHPPRPRSVGGELLHGRLLKEPITAVLLESTSDSLRVVHLDAEFEIARADVLEMAEDGAAYVVTEGQLRAVPVRLRLRAGAAVEAVGVGARARESLARDQAPFLVAVRQVRPARPANAESYLRKETEFLRGWGLLDDDS